MTVEIGKIVGGKYRLEKPLAQGGMGSVWLARHTELDAPVAVKFMAGELVGTPAAEARFKREAKAAAQLRSPHVVHIHDYGVEDGAPFMVMELLDGVDLAAEIARHGRLPIARVASVVAQVAKALSLAHAAGIVHRDLKPSNLFLARSGDDEIVKVLDFGVAKETMPTLVVDKTTSGVLIGSPQYMSPEQARGESVDFHSDLWSLGVVIFEALTGRPPFDSNHLGALLAKILEARPPAPTSLAPDLPPGADDFMRRALARAPEDRFPSVKAMADALAALEDSDPRPAVPAPHPPSIVVTPAAVIARSADTLPAAGPDPVSTTMHERRVLPGPLARRKQAIVGLAIASAAAIAAGAVWFALGPTRGEPRGVRDGDVPATSVSAGPLVSPAAAGPARSTASLGPASAGAANGSAAAPASSGAERPPTTTAPPRPSVPGTGTKPAPPVASSTAVSPRPPPSAKTQPAPTTAPYDPTFGLPAQKP